MKPRYPFLFGLLLIGVAVGSYELGRRNASSATVQKPIAVPASAAVTRKASASTQAPAKTWRSAKESKLYWEERIQAARSMPERLSDSSLQELISFLHEAPEGPKNEWYLICNEIMEVLRKRNLAPESYTKHMLALIQDDAGDPVIRDYAVQTLAQWIAGMDVNLGHESNADLAQKTFALLLTEAQKASNGQLTLAGTTLNALADTVITGNAEMKSQKASLAVVAFAMAEGGSSLSPVNRSTAIQVAARLEVAGVSDLCRKLVADDGVPADVRLSAIAALGMTGSRSDQELLKTAAKDYRFKYAANVALQRLIQP